MPINTCKVNSVRKAGRVDYNGSQLPKITDQSPLAVTVC